MENPPKKRTKGEKGAEQGFKKRNKRVRVGAGVEGLFLTSGPAQVRRRRENGVHVPEERLPGEGTHRIERTCFKEHCGEVQMLRQGLACRRFVWTGVLLVLFKVKSHCLRNPLQRQSLPASSSACPWLQLQSRRAGKSLIRDLDGWAGWGGLGAQTRMLARGM